MKKQFWVAYLLLVTGACQPQQAVKPPTDYATASAIAAKWPAATADTSPSIPVRFSKVLRSDIVSQPVRDVQQTNAFFRVNNLATLLQTVRGRPSDYALNGFRGSDQYRTEVVVLTAQRNAHDPTLYKLTGLTRTRRRIARFTGHIKFDSLSTEPLLTATDKRNIKNWSMVALVQSTNREPVQRFAIAGKVHLQEQHTTTAAGYFDGRLVVELARTKAGHLRTDAPFMHGPSLGGAQRYVGTWTTYQTRQVTPGILVEDTFGDALFKQEDFLLGDRDAAINPAYAKKGWNTLWENEEWWADSPKPSLSL